MIDFSCCVAASEVQAIWVIGPSAIFSESPSSVQVPLNRLQPVEPDTMPSGAKSRVGSVPSAGEASFHDVRATPPVGFVAPPLLGLAVVVVVDRSLSAVTSSPPQAVRTPASARRANPAAIPRRRVRWELVGVYIPTRWHTDRRLGAR